MTYLEILRLAFDAVCVKINKEEGINNLTKNECGHENTVSVARLEKLWKQYDELRTQILREEDALRDFASKERRYL